MNGSTNEPGQDLKHQKKAEAHMAEIVKEKHALDKDTFPIASRLLDEGM